MKAHDTATDSPWLNTTESAAYVKRGRRFILREIHAGRLRAAKIGGRGEILCRREWLDEWVEREATPADVFPRRAWPAATAATRKEQS